MTKFILLKPRIYIVLAGFILLPLIILPITVTSADNNSSSVSNSTQDCDSNAVIRCGVSSVNDLQSQYYNTPSTQTVFHNFGITHNDINAMGNTAVNGRVTRGGRVIVDGQTVANNAMTAGMQNMSGSQAVTHNGVTYYTRPPSVSFASSSLPAYVVMNNGQFSYAVIKSCGNPVTATPINSTTAQPTAPQPTPSAISQNQTQSQTQTQSQEVNVSTPPPPSYPVTNYPSPYTSSNTTTPTTYTAPTPAPQPVVTQPQYTNTKGIPNTGPGEMIGLGTAVAIPSSIAHYIYKRRRV